MNVCEEKVEAWRRNFPTYALAQMPAKLEELNRVAAEIRSRVKDITLLVKHVDSLNNRISKEIAEQESKLFSIKDKQLYVKIRTISAAVLTKELAPGEKVRFLRIVCDDYEKYLMSKRNNKIANEKLPIVRKLIFQLKAEETDNETKLMNFKAALSPKKEKALLQNLDGLGLLFLRVIANLFNSQSLKRKLSRVDGVDFMLAIHRVSPISLFNNNKNPHKNVNMLTFPKLIKSNGWKAAESGVRMNKV